jgi:hypothetical protein
MIPDARGRASIEPPGFIEFLAFIAVVVFLKISRRFYCTMPVASSLESHCNTVLFHAQTVDLDFRREQIAGPQPRLN